PAPSSVKLSVALRLPTAVGEKVTPTVQVAFTAIAFPEQVSALMAKSPVFDPVMLTALICSVAPLALVSVTVWAALVVPMFWLPKLRLVGLKAGGDPPLLTVPLS